MSMENILNMIVQVKWLDSYGVQSGWQDISEYKANKLEITSVGKVIYEDDDVISLAHNFADETENTCMQANGIMTIPKVCIVQITPCGVLASSCQGLASGQRQQQS